MRTLSKSKVIAWRQCPKRLWLEIHRPDLKADSASTQASYQVGHAVGDLARQLYDPKNEGTLLDAQTEGFDTVFRRSLELIQEERPLFEAGFRAAGAMCFADVLLPVGKGAQRGWRMVEVKSSGGLKDYYRDDAAVQAFVVRQAGVPLRQVAVAHIDTSWVYPGNGDYRGLLVECDLSEEVVTRESEVADWIGAAQAVAALPEAPELGTGSHCTSPYECGFIGHCTAQEPRAEYPVQWLPRVQAKALKAHLASTGVRDMRDVPDALLNPTQLRVKQHTLSGQTYFDVEATAAALAAYKLPAYYLDFETIQFAVPIWAGTRPYQQVPFQFSLHRVGRTGKIEHQEFLDLSGADPSGPFAEALIAACGELGPIFVYNKGFEGARIKELAERFPSLARPLNAIRERLVDLKPIAEAHYYHPDQQGSWSIKKVLTAVAPELSYSDLDGVQHGGAAQEAFLEAVHADTPADRKAMLRTQLLAYCKLDTFAMVRLWQVFSGRG